MTLVHVSAVSAFKFAVQVEHARALVPPSLSNTHPRACTRCCRTLSAEEWNFVMRDTMQVWDFVMRELVMQDTMQVWDFVICGSGAL